MRDEALRRLHALLVRAARFQLRSAASRSQLRGECVEELATEAADDALVSILAHRGDFRGASRFVTWASKIAMFEASGAVRRRSRTRRELPLETDGWSPPELAAAGPEETLEQLEWLHALRVAIDEVLSERQRLVFVSIALNDVPIDVVAQKLDATRGAVYKTLHDARRRLRAHLELGPAETELGRAEAAARHR
ncbi:MAG TPA: sigma-70 family RNA polymerase sigma factor [Gaiella sp.]|nr:sigma-70 family RNA polymerase sigma factor [Gaiella sp.]